MQHVRTVYLFFKVFPTFQQRAHRANAQKGSDDTGLLSNGKPFGDCDHYPVDSYPTFYSTFAQRHFILRITIHWIASLSTG